MASRSRRTNAGKTKGQTLEEQEYALAIAQSSATSLLLTQPKTKLERKLYLKSKQQQEQETINLKINLLKNNFLILMSKKNNYIKMIATCTKINAKGQSILPVHIFYALVHKIGQRMKMIGLKEILQATWLSVKNKSTCPNDEIEHQVLGEWLGIDNNVAVVAAVEEEKAHKALGKGQNKKRSFDAAEFSDTDAVVEKEKKKKKRRGGGGGGGGRGSQQR